MGKTYTKEDMQPIVDFLAKGAGLITEEHYKTNLEKIVNNFKVALDAAADNEEKHAYLYALYVNNAAALASYLFLNNLLTSELEKEFRTMPTAKDAEAAIEQYRKAAEDQKDQITEAQKAYVEHNRGLEVFKGIALGDTPDEAKAGVEAHEQRIAQAMTN